MICSKCRYRYVEVVHNHSDGSAYKYNCKKDRFLALESTFRLGSSYPKDGKIFYTENQLKNFCSKKWFCIDKFGVSKAEFWRLIFTVFSVILSLYSLYISKREENKRENFNKYQKVEINNIITDKVDSIFKIEYDQRDSKNDVKLLRNTSNLPVKSNNEWPYLINR